MGKPVSQRDDEDDEEDDDTVITPQFIVYLLPLNPSSLSNLPEGTVVKVRETLPCIWY